MNISHSITSVEKRYRTVQWYHFIIRLLAFGFTGALLSLGASYLSVYLGVLCLALTVIIIGYRALQDQARLRGSTLEACRALDRHFDAHERFISLAEIGDKGAVSELLQNQISLITRPFAVEDVVPFHFDKRAKIFASVSVLSFLFIALLLLLLGSPFIADRADAVRAIKSALEDPSELTPKLERALENLERELSEPVSSLGDIEDALREAEQALKEAKLEESSGKKSAATQMVLEPEARTASAEETPAKKSSPPTPTPTPTTPAEDKSSREQAEPKPAEEEKKEDSEKQQGGGGEKSEEQEKQEGQSGKSSGQSQDGEGEGNSPGEKGEGEQKSQDKSNNSGKGNSESKSEGEGKQDESSQSEGEGKGGDQKGDQKQQSSSQQNKGEQGQQGEGGEQGSDALNKAEQAINKAKEALDSEKKKGQGEEQDQQGEKKKGDQQGSPSDQAGQKPGDKKGDEPQQQGGSGGKQSNQDKKPETKDPQGKSQGEKESQKKEESKAKSGSSAQPGDEDKENDSPAQSSSLPRDKQETREYGEGDGKPWDGIKGEKEFKESGVSAQNEQFDSRYTGSESELKRNTLPSAPRTKLEDVILARPEVKKGSEEQKIPLEYREIMEE